MPADALFCGTCGKKTDELIPAENAMQLVEPDRRQKTKILMGAALAGTAIVILLALFLWPGLLRNQEPASLVGRWEVVEGTDLDFFAHTMEFFDDGSGRMASSLLFGLAVTEEFTWQLNGGRLVITSQTLGFGLTYDLVELSADRLIYEARIPVLGTIIRAEYQRVR